MKTEYGVVRNVDYQTGEVGIQLDSGLWIEGKLNPADVQDMVSDDVVSVTFNRDMSFRHIEMMEI